ncbi:MAG: hypothetical protein JSW66_10755 [Phycisphaerales bacterium]|nr:MAG: hypothetical protein JSW66_10755 [Phycisphaerales bacterium]
MNMTHPDILKTEKYGLPQSPASTTTCISCQAKIRIEDQIRCEICGRYGCSRCLSEHPQTAETICQEDCLQRAIERACEKAAASGSRDDLRAYLRLRKRAEQELKGDFMSPSNTEGAQALETVPDRGIIRRLWESYAEDLIQALTEARDGSLSELEAHDRIGRLGFSMKALRQDGPLSQTLRRAELVMVNGVLRDLDKEREKERK